MFGIRLMFLLAVMGGLIAFIADKLGSKIGKKKLSVFGLRPHDTSVLLTVLSGVLIALFSPGLRWPVFRFCFCCSSRWVCWMSPSPSTSSSCVNSK